MSDICINESVLISIILPVYNVERYIDRCFLSCIKQTYTNFEIIVVDDASNDSSIDQASKWAKQDSRIRIVTCEVNLGTYHARRLGVQKASGKYVLFLDPDDELACDAINEIAIEIRKNDADIVFYGVKRIPEELFQAGEEISNGLGEITTDLHRKILSSKGFSYGTAGKLYRTSIIKNVFEKLSVDSSFRLIYAEDVLIFYGALIMSKTFSSISNKLYLYHRNSDSITMRCDKDLTIFQCSQIDAVIKTINCFVANSKGDTNYIFIKQLSFRFYCVLVISKHLNLSKFYFRKCHFRFLSNFLKVVFYKVCAIFYKIFMLKN